MIQPGIPGFAKQDYFAKLTYYESFTITCGAAAVGNYVFTANGLYDPNVTSTGHQPMPFDQLMLSFEHYCVVESRIHVYFRNTSDAASLAVALSLNAGSTPTTSIIAYVENGNLVRDRLSPFPTNDSTLRLSMPINIGRFGGVPNVRDDPDYRGSVAANPVEQSYFHVSAWNPDTVATPDVICEAYIEYWAWFTEPRKNSASLNSAMHRLLIAEEKSSSRKN
jgi:hypothetical protein